MVEKPIHQSTMPVKRGKAESSSTCRRLHSFVFSSAAKSTCWSSSTCDVGASCMDEVASAIGPIRFYYSGSSWLVAGETAVNLN
jgi:hypothetical protein